MKKVLCLFLLVAFVAGIASASPSLGRKPYIITNNTGSVVFETVATTTIVPGRTKILGFEIKGVAGSGVTPWATLYDAGSTAGTVASAIMGEAEAPAGERDRQNWNLYPKTVATQLGVRVGAYTIVEIHYAR